MRDPRELITRSPDLSGLAPRVAALFNDWQQINDAQLAAGDVSNEVHQSFFEAVTAAGERIAAFKPRTLHEASSLLAAVFLDEAADDAWGLFVPEQVAVVANVKRFLAAHVAHQPEAVL